MYCTAKDNAYNEPTDENAVHKLGDMHQATCTLEVDHNENEQMVTSIHTGNPYTVSDSISDDTSASVDESTTGHHGASSQVCSPVNNMSVVISTRHTNGHSKLSETDSDSSITQNAGMDPVCKLQYTRNNFALSESYSGTDSDLVSQSQGLQLTNTQKLEIFAMELDMMKPPASAHSSQNSLFDSLTGMSAMLM